MRAEQTGIRLSHLSVADADGMRVCHPGTLPMGEEEKGERVGVREILPGADVCKMKGYKMAYIACVVPCTAYFMAHDGSRYRCVE